METRGGRRETREGRGVGNKRRGSRREGPYRGRRDGDTELEKLWKRSQSASYPRMREVEHGAPGGAVSRGLLLFPCPPLLLFPSPLPSLVSISPPFSYFHLPSLLLFPCSNRKGRGDPLQTRCPPPPPPPPPSQTPASNRKGRGDPHHEVDHGAPAGAGGPLAPAPPRGPPARTVEGLRATTGASTTRRPNGKKPSEGPSGRAVCAGGEAFGRRPARARLGGPTAGPDQQVLGHV